MKIRKVLVALTIGALLGGIASTAQAASVTPLPKGASATNGYGIVLNASAAKTVDIWEDFQCPFCNAFEGKAATFSTLRSKHRRSKLCITCSASSEQSPS